MERKQQKRPQRLQNAKVWLPTYTGKRLCSAYRKRYGTDWSTTFLELEMLGVAIDPAYQEQVLHTAQIERERKQQKKLEHTMATDLGAIEQNDTFAFIVGYTSGGAPYGITWEECTLLSDEESE